MTDRKFYKTEYRVTVLTEEPIRDASLAELDYVVTQGDGVGQLTLTSEVILNGKDVADALYSLASNPGFFSLDDEGNDTE